ncbi:hypothetical protein LINGRAHAP2_LOCUS14407 [Linum grandiflorum]
MLLRDLSPGEPPAELRLRLQHVWRHCNPAEPDKFFAFGTDVEPPPPLYRACRFRHWLALGPATEYELLPPDVGAAFKPESYEFVPFAQFPGRLPPCPYLTDYVGKVIAVGKPNHVPRGSGVALVQTVIVVDSSSGYCCIPQFPDPAIHGFVVSLDSLQSCAALKCLFGLLKFTIGLFCRLGKTTVSSGLASCVLPDPLHPSAESLRAHFASQERSVRYIVPKFDTPEKLKRHMEDSYRTIRELDEMLVAAGDSVSHVAY